MYPEYRMLAKVRGTVRMMRQIAMNLDHVKDRFKALQDQLNRIERGLYVTNQTLNSRMLDTMLKLDQMNSYEHAAHIKLVTNNPVAWYSDDHKFPRGTANDNTRSLRFVEKIEKTLGKNLKILDLGCSGGGLVLNFLQRGHFAMGLEGSDFSLKNQRAEWPLIPYNLRTCDITQPFTLQNDNGEPLKFDLITSWEVLEHIEESKLGTLFNNIKRHLAPNGYFMGSVATFPDADPETGAVWHVTLQEKPWWEQKFAEQSLIFDSSLDFEARDFPRGSGNPGDWDAALNPELGFHVIAKLKNT